MSSSGASFQRTFTITGIALSPFTNYYNGLVDVVCLEHIFRYAIGVAESQLVGASIAAAIASAAEQQLSHTLFWSPKRVTLGDVADVTLHVAVDASGVLTARMEVAWPESSVSASPIGRVESQWSPTVSVGATNASSLHLEENTRCYEMPLREIADSIGISSAVSNKSRQALWVASAITNLVLAGKQNAASIVRTKFHFCVADEKRDAPSEAPGTVSIFYGDDRHEGSRTEQVLRGRVSYRDGVADSRFLAVVSVGETQVIECAERS